MTGVQTCALPISVKSSDLDLDIISLSTAETEELQLSDIEKISIEKVLYKNNFNISKSAEELGLSRAALYRRMEKYNLDPTDQKQ